MKNEDLLDDLLQEVRGLVNLICNMLPTTEIKGKIESKALYIAHHPMILNHAPQKIKERAASTNKQSTPCDKCIMDVGALNDCPMFKKRCPKCF